jgi:hypothetical protein
VIGATGPVADAYAWRNRLTNGDFRVALRAGTSFSAPVSGTYTLDRWMINWSGAAPATVDQVAGIGGLVSAIQLTGAAGNTSASLSQRIESVNVADLVGNSCSLSAIVAASTPQTVNWVISYPTSGTDTYTSGATVIASGAWSVGTTASGYSASISSLASGAANGLQVSLYPEAGGPFTGGTVTITGVQFEAGSVPTSFEQRPIAYEQLLCRRYAMAVHSPAPVIFNGSGHVYTNFAFSNGMRASPTATYTGTLAITMPGYGDYTASSPILTVNQFMSAASTTFVIDISGFGGTSNSGSGFLKSGVVLADAEIY